MDSARHADKKTILNFTQIPQNSLKICYIFTFFLFPSYHPFPHTFSFDFVDSTVPTLIYFIKFFVAIYYFVISFSYSHAVLFITFCFFTDFHFVRLPFALLFFFFVCHRLPNAGIMITF